jgi:hypothetical protein
MVEAVEWCEPELLAVLSEEEREIYEQFALPTFFPDKTSTPGRDLPHFDESFSKRWVTRRAYEFGWNSQRFPSDHGHSGMSSERPQMERIGKKYQWLALSELLARLSTTFGRSTGRQTGRRSTTILRTTGSSAISSPRCWSILRRRKCAHGGSLTHWT